MSLLSTFKWLLRKDRSFPKSVTTHSFIVQLQDASVPFLRPWKECLVTSHKSFMSLFSILENRWSVSSKESFCQAIERPGYPVLNWGYLVGNAIFWKHLLFTVLSWRYPWNLMREGEYGNTDTVSYSSSCCSHPFLSPLQRKKANVSLEKF